MVQYDTDLRSALALASYGIGIHRSAPFGYTSLKSGGVIPITEYLCPFRVISLLMILGSAPKLRRHSPSLIIATRLFSSESTNVRDSSAFGPSTEKRLSDTI